MAIYRLCLLKSPNIASWVDANHSSECDAVTWAQLTGGGFEWELWDYGSAPARQVAVSESFLPA
jgi:hypothetical protein